ncbi:hypothetical protein GA0115233_103012 [Streptomyces sp. DI166]|uniref:hypothetical protein n=1 Tax=Streptomyces sp. DI166 TaxID=1839783 RepID=UPI0007F4217F|nr:hypothetical protein [Streptomyces sp. DI166]SBT91380.1 hypothetical protein GA0115233_103012 [Streptomyces sp. DI166]
MIDTKHWLKQAARIHQDAEYTYSHLARDLADRLGWTAALNVATALRSHVYGWPSSNELHTAVKPLYDRLGWEQSALLCCWFRDARNRPGRRPGGWPAAATPTPKESS